MRCLQSALNTGRQVLPRQGQAHTALPPEPGLPHGDEDTSQGTKSPLRHTGHSVPSPLQAKTCLESDQFGNRVSSTLCFAVELHFVSQFIALKCGAALAERNKYVTCHSSSHYLLESELGLTLTEGGVGLVRKQTAAWP